MGKLEETIELKVVALPVKDNALGGLITQLKEVQTYIQAIETTLKHGFSIPALRGMAELKAQIAQLQTKGGGLNPETLASGLGFDDKHLASFRKFMAEYKQAKRDLLRVGEFRSVPSAASAFSSFQTQLAAEHARSVGQFKQLFTPAASHFAGGASGAKVAEQLHASVVNLQTPVVNLHGAVVNLSGAVAGVGAAGRSQTSATAVGAAAGTRVKAGDIATELRHRASLEAEAFRSGASVLARGDAGGRSAAKLKYAAQLEALITQELAASDFRTVQRAVERVRGTAGRQRAEAAALSMATALPNVRTLTAAEVESGMGRSQAQYARDVEAGRLRALRRAERVSAFDAAHSGAVETKPDASLVKYYRDIEAARLRREREAEQAGRRVAAYNAANTPPVIPPPVIPGLGRGGPGGGGYLSSLGSKFVGLTQYGIAATALYQGAALGNYTAGRAVDIDQQSKRLGQVYRGRSEDVRALTDDVLKLAAANGRETKEAMDSTIAWARLGLNRVQINDAVAVSLKAANVAELSAGDATRYLSGIMATYKLNVNQVGESLSMMNDVSNKLNVTNRDLFESLARSSGAAKQFGLGLPELIGLSSGLISRGQTGSQSGNFIKTLLTRMGDPAKQEYLSKNFGLEPTDSAGNLKGGSQRLQEFWETYQRASKQQREGINVQMAGATQANRLSIFMDEYTASILRSVEAMHNLNSANIENERIMKSVKSQWQSVGAEYDRAVHAFASGSVAGVSPMSLLSTGLRGARNTMSGSTNAFNKVLGVLPGGGANPLTDSMTQNAVLSLLPGILPKIFAVANAANSGETFRDAQEISIQRKLQGGQGKLNAAALDGRLANTLPGLKPEVQQSVLSQVGMGGMDVGEAVEQLKKRSGSNRRAGQKELAEAQKEQEALAKNIQADLDRGNLTAEKRNELEARLVTVLAKGSELREQINDTEQDALGIITAHTQGMQNLIGSTQAQMSSLEQAFSQLSADSFTGRLDQSLSLLQEKVRLLHDAEESAEASGYTELSSQYRAERASALGQMSGLQQPGIAALAGMMDDRTVAMRAGKMEGDNMGLGATRAEQLLDKRKQLERELSALRNKPNRDDDDNSRGAQLQIQYEQTRLEIVERIGQLKREEKQLMIEGRQEFNKSLLTAGPGALLQKLVANNFKGGAGGFFALDPSIRQDVLTLNGGADVLRNRREQGLLGAPPTVREQQLDARFARAGANDWQQGLNRRAADARGPVIDVQTVETAKAAANLALMNTALMRTAPLMQVLADAVENAVARIAVVAPARGVRGGVDVLPAALGFAAGAA